MKASICKTTVEVEPHEFNAGRPVRYGINIKQLDDFVFGPSYRTRKHAEKAAKKLRKMLGI